MRIRNKGAIDDGRFPGKVTTVWGC